ncbi:polysaccharide biosynthesis protein, partial [Ilumatobacter sp.]|uniref:polysaccharide biosynthesis protein n=1 Tax=Ilumatobacter sp. TaxID=1967498 RepID=UPI003AF51056
MTPIDPDLTPLDRHVIGRTTSFFGADLERSVDELRESIGGSTMLIIGGAGSIGGSTMRAILSFAPREIHVIDHNENGLAELVRDLRSSHLSQSLPEMTLLPFDVGGDPFRLWLSANGAHYDHVLNFAALKHVRSEKDPFSILAMLETNVLHLDRIPRLLADRPGLRRVFSVSTDKAANPHGMMGATKRLMEHALFSPTQPWADTAEVASARFANVAFSNGSLLQGWQHRLASGQPLACPEDCRRYFVSLSESGHLCTLAGFLGRDRTLTIPALDPSTHLVLLSDVATRFLDFHGYEAYVTRDPHEALHRVDELGAARRWPLLLTPLDTGGEKPYEEFVGEHETSHDTAFEALRELPYLPPAVEGSYAALVEATRDLLSDRGGDSVSVHDLKDLISQVEPAFAES